MTVIVKDEEALQEARKIYDTLFDAPLEVQEGFVQYEAHREIQVEQLQGIGGARVLLRVAQNDDEKDQVKGRDFWYGDVVLAVKAVEGKNKGKKEQIDNNLRGIWLEYV